MADVAAGLLQARPAGGGTKLVLNQNFIGMPTSGQNVGPIDISAFAKIRFLVTVNGLGSIQFYLLSGTGGQTFSGLHWMISRWMLEVALSPAPMM